MVKQPLSCKCVLRDCASRLAIAVSAIKVGAPLPGSGIRSMHCRGFEANKGMCWAVLASVPAIESAVIGDAIPGSAWAVVPVSGPHYEVAILGLAKESGELIIRAGRQARQIDCWRNDASAQNYHGAK